MFAHYWHHNDEEKMLALHKEAAQELEELFEENVAEQAAG